MTACRSPCVRLASRTAPVPALRLKAVPSPCRPSSRPHLLLVVLLYAAFSVLETQPGAVCRAFAPSSLVRSLPRWLASEIEPSTHADASRVFLPRTLACPSSFGLRLSSSNRAQDRSDVVDNPTLLSLRTHLSEKDASTKALVSGTLRSIWYAQEVLATFDKGELDAVLVYLPDIQSGPATVLQPNSRSNGSTKLTVILSHPSMSSNTSNQTVDAILWDSTIDGDNPNSAVFPSTKNLKQQIRDLVAPAQFLGHSDTESKQQQQQQQSQDDCLTCPTDKAQTTVARQDTLTRGTQIRQFRTSSLKPSSTSTVGIAYCTGCRWLQRAAYLAQEILLDAVLDTDTPSITSSAISVALIPSAPPHKGGQFTETYNDETIFDRAVAKRFPKTDEVIHMIRQMQSNESSTNAVGDGGPENGDNGMTDDEAEEARRYFGVA